MPKKQVQEDVLASFDPTFWKPNTTYLMCNDVHHLNVPVLDGNVADESPNISFLIPPMSLGGEESGMLLAVTCKVTDVNMVPLVKSESA